MRGYKPKPAVFAVDDCNCTNTTLTNGNRTKRPVSSVGYRFASKQASPAAHPENHDHAVALRAAADEVLAGVSTKLDSRGVLYSVYV